MRSELKTIRCRGCGQWLAKYEPSGTDVIVKKRNRRARVTRYWKPAPGGPLDCPKNIQWQYEPDKRSLVERGVMVPLSAEEVASQTPPPDYVIVQCVDCKLDYRCTSPMW